LHHYVIMHFNHTNTYSWRWSISPSTKDWVILGLWTAASLHLNIQSSRITICDIHWVGIQSSFSLANTLHCKGFKFLNQLQQQHWQLLPPIKWLQAQSAMFTWYMSVNVHNYIILHLHTGVPMYSCSPTSSFPFHSAFVHVYMLDASWNYTTIKAHSQKLFCQFTVIYPFCIVIPYNGKFFCGETARNVKIGE
jgi:hypothetical protein